MPHRFLRRFAVGASTVLLLLTAVPALAAEPDPTQTPAPTPTPSSTPGGGVDADPADPDAAVVLSGIVLDREETPVPLEYGAVWGTTVGGEKFHVAADARPREGHSLLITPSGRFRASVPPFAVATIQLQGLGRISKAGNCFSTVALHAEKRMTREDVTPGRALTLVARETRTGGSCAATPSAVAPGTGGRLETGGTDAAPTRDSGDGAAAGTRADARSPDEVAGLTPPATAAADRGTAPAETPLRPLLVVLVAAALALAAGPGSVAARRRQPH